MNIPKVVIPFTFFLVVSCSDDSQVTTKDPLTGTWQLEYYDDSNEGTLIVPGNETAILTFRNGNLSGKIGFNTIANGTFAHEGEILTLSYGISEIGGSQWEERFQESLAALYDEGMLYIPVTLFKSELIFHYGGQSTMHFHKKN